MALHYQLPIYRTARDLLYLAVAFSRKTPRDLRNTIGNRMVSDTFELAMLVFRANVAADKAPYLNEMIEGATAMGMLFRLCSDFRIISEVEYAKAVELISSISKQATGWRNAQKR